VGSRRCPTSRSRSSSTRAPPRPGGSSSRTCSAPASPRRELKDLCFRFVADPDSIELERFEGRERAALDWAYAIVWDADQATDELWKRLHSHFTEEELVDLGCAIGFELGRTHFLRTLKVSATR